MAKHVITNGIRRFTGLLVVLALLTGNSIQAAAASGWDEALDQINELYSSYISLQETVKAESKRNQALRKQNISDLAAINARLELTDQALLSRLKSEAEAVQKKHAMLLAQYSALSKQAAAARKAGNLKSVTALDLQRNKLKPAVTAARAEIKSKNTALAVAKAAASARNKPAKDALSPIAGFRKQVTAGNKQVSEIQTVRSEADKRYKAAVKAGDAVTAAAAMKLSCTKMEDIRTWLTQINNLEQKITTALRLAETKLPN
ncbi:hypothetical protein PAECIP111892_00193 [Paenibacillus auburnensis]|uniref:Colicin import membrane protein n=1 Tax=Paenibacillus auburnensis TaxID=2905649 RepID=A0ABN8FQV7_9BACL|nr:hypothetical protein [Paenibacillus auburnensis]CAH1190444.1 hypothetical protein PAECIP111892_00193 [Paenibacillus auburnensis]